MKTVLKPKHAKTQVPGFGVVSREDFNEEHLKAVLKQIKAAGIDEKQYLAKRFDVVSFEGALFSEEEEESAKKAAEEAEEAKKKAEEEAELLKQLEAEEAARKKAEEAAKKSSDKKS